MDDSGYGDVLVDDWWQRIERTDHPLDGARTYRAGGDGDARFLLLHDVGNSGAVWGPLMPALAEHGPVVAPTLSPELLVGPDGGPTESLTPFVELMPMCSPISRMLICGSSECHWAIASACSRPYAMRTP